MDTSTILTELYSERDRINSAITALEALNGTAVSQQMAKIAARTAKPGGARKAKTVTTAASASKKRVMSPEGRKRIAEAQQKRWAKKKRAVKAAAKKAAATAPTETKSAKGIVKG